MAGMRRALIAAAALALLAGCASADELTPESPAASEAPAPTAADPEPAREAETPEPEPEPPVEADAATLAAALVEAVDSASGFTEYTEDSDPNDLIGRPGQYISAASISDDGADGDSGVDAGAVIEVFASEADAQARSEYILAILKDSPMLGVEWHHLDGVALLRVSGALKPSVNDVYAEAWASIVG